MTDNSTPEESSVEFHGPGPFDLPVSQESYAETQGGAVTIGFRVLVDPSRVAAVRIAVLNNQALKLAREIVEAAARGMYEANAKSES